MHHDTHIVRPPPLPLPPITSSPSAPSQLLPFLEPHSHHDDDPCEMVFFLRCISSAPHSLINCGHDYTIFVPCTAMGSQVAERIGQERSLLYFCCTDTSKTVSCRHPHNTPPNVLIFSVFLFEESSSSSCLKAIWLHLVGE